MSVCGDDIVKSLGKWALGGTAAVLSAASAAAAGPIPVQNAVFDAPAVTWAQQASPFAAGWNLSGPADGYIEVAPGYFVNANTGVFQNTASNQPNHIDNVAPSPTVISSNTGTAYEGAAYIGAETGNTFQQTLTGYTFQAGQSYTLTVGVAHNYGSASQVPDPSAYLRLLLYYLDGNSQRQIVAERDVYNDAATGLSATHFLDFSAASDALAPSSPAIGQPIQVEMTTVGPLGGFFDVDNVRVNSVPEPASLAFISLGALGVLARRRGA